MRAVERYPLPPGALRSASHEVLVDGRPLDVERWADVGYARFAMGGKVDVRIAVANPITAHTIFPAERVANAAVRGTELHLDLDSPLSVVIWINDLEKLFLLPDPLETEAPDPNAAGSIDITTLGADPTGRVLATSSIQAALNRASARGGGTVIVPPGRFVTGTLSVKSDVTLYLAAGALLEGSSDPADYPVDAGRHESASDPTLPADVRFLGRTMTFTRLFLVDRARNVRICGRGTIDGHGTELRTRGGIAPNLLRVRESHGIEIADVLFRDAAAWSVHLLASSDLTCRNVKIVNDRTNLNTDGIDLDMSSDAVVDGSFIYTKDDAICVKATGHAELSGEPRRISARDNLLSSLDAALKVGTESEAARFSDIAFEDNHVFETGRAMSIVVRDGASYERVAFRGVDVGPRVDHLVEQVIGVRDPAAALGSIRDLAIERVVAPTFVKPASNWTWYAQFRPGRPEPGSAVDVFEGADDEHALTGLALEGFVVGGELLSDAESLARIAGLTIGRHVRDVTIG